MQLPFGGNVPKSPGRRLGLRPPPRRLFARAELVHLVSLIAALVAILVVIGRLRTPAGQAWFADFDASPPREATADVADIAKADAARPTPDAPGPGQVNPLGLVQIHECRSVDRFLLDKVRDKTPAGPADDEAIYQLMCVASTTPADRLAAESRRDVLFSNLFNNPADYRGIPIHLQGTLRRLLVRENKSLKNAYAIERYYEAWMFTEDQAHNPTLVLFAKSPAGLGPGTDLKETISIDAFFLKLFAYRAQDDKVHAAPMLIGYLPTWRRVPDVDFWTRTAPFVLVGLCMVAAAGFYFWWQSRRDEKLAGLYRRGAPLLPGNPFEAGTLDANDRASELGEEL